MTFRRLLFALLIILGLIAAYRIFFLRGSDPLRGIDKKLEISTSRIEEQMKEIASLPHRAGTENNHAVADSIVRRLQAAGLKTSVVEYEFQLPEPAQSELWLLAPEEKQIDISEKALSQDPYSKSVDLEIPFFAYAPDAMVEAEAIYANLGTRADYDWLKKNGVEVRGKIAVIRSTGCRGMSQIAAEEEGVAGLLLYPEIRDQGFRKTPYPDGPHLNPWTIQRGSMLRFFETPGDPMQPKASSLLPKVPSLPINSEAAASLLIRIHGVNTPTDWKGGMDGISYDSGQGPRIRMMTKSILKKRKTRNIFGYLNNDPVSSDVGSILVGCHYDAWVFGAADPSSGVAATLEAAESLSGLHKKGWNQHRPVAFAFWDAEEYGMLSSDRWVNENRAQVQRFLTFVYVDGVRAHYLSGNVLPGLQGLLDDVLSKVQDPDTGKPVIEIRRKHDLPNFTSDTIPFILAGIPTAQFNYGGSYSMYHSAYDNLHWFTKYADPGYRYTAAMARILAMFTLRLADPSQVSFRFSEFAQYIADSSRQIQLAHDDPSLFSELIREAEALQETAKRWETDGSKDPREINEVLMKSLALFHGQKDLLVGPSAENGCGGESLPRLRGSKVREEIGKLRKILGEIRKNMEIL